MQDKNLTLLVRKRIFLKPINFKENIFIDKNPLNSKFQFQTYKSNQHLNILTMPITIYRNNFRNLKLNI